MHNFLGDVLPDTGHYRLVLVPIAPEKVGRTFWADTIDGLAELATKYADRTRVYFGSASYIEPTKGEAANVLLNKALRLDIDAGEAKFKRHGPDAVYASQRDALVDLRRFIAETHLKPSYVVSSGEGLHVYYCLEHALPPKEWGALAKRMALMCQQHGLKVDPNITEDVTRLLRPVGVKHENGSEVRVLVGRGTPLTTDALDAALPRIPTFSDEDLAENDAFLESFEGTVQHPPTSALKIAERCPSLLAVAEARGDVPEPAWRAMLGLVKHTVEGDNLAHQWSEGYDGYDERETQKKLDLWRTGPTTCEEFAKHSDRCNGCAYRGKIKSPIMLGRLNDSEQAALPPEQQTTLAPPEAPPSAPGKPWDGLLPENTRVVESEDGHLTLQYVQKKVSKDEDGNSVTTKVWVPITHTVFWFSQWGEANHSEDTAQAVLCVWMGTHVKSYEVSQGCLASSAKLTEVLSAKAVHTTNHPMAAKAAIEYGKAQFTHMSTVHKNLRITDRFGVRVLDSGELVAVHGRYTIHGDGTLRDTIMPPNLRRMAKDYPIPMPPGAGRELWSPEVWDTNIIPAARRYVEFINRRFGAEGYEPFQLAIALAIASPLMPFIKNTYHSGDELPKECALSLSLYSKSGGRGKTTAAQVGVMAYGDPDRLSQGAGSDSSTDLARTGQLSISGSMPAVMDEVGDLTRGQVFRLLNQVANGQARKRLLPDGTVQMSQPWALINTLTTNYALTDILSESATVNDGTPNSDAVHRRILEIDVGNVPDHSAEDRASFTAEYGTIKRDCSGALGALLHREIARLGVEGVNAFVARQVIKASELLGAGQADRFMSRALGALLASQVLLHRLGLEPFDTNTLVETFKHAHQRSLEAIESMEALASPLEMLSRGLRALAPTTLVTFEETHGSRMSRKFDAVLNLRPPAEVNGRHIQNLGISYISAEALRVWASDNRVSLRSMIDAARAERVLVRPKTGSQNKPYARKVLTTGIAGSTGEAVLSYTFDVARLSRLLDREDGDAPNVANIYMLETGQQYAEQLSESAEATP